MIQELCFPSEGSPKSKEGEESPNFSSVDASAKRNIKSVKAKIREASGQEPLRKEKRKAEPNSKIDLKLAPATQVVQGPKKKKARDHVFTPKKKSKTINKAPKKKTKEASEGGFACPHCHKIFPTHTCLGGHNSKAHPGKS